MRLRGVAPLGLWLVAAVPTSLAEGTPDPLPTVALGSAALLHACRAAALFAIGLSLGTILARAGAGRLPVQLSTSGVAWEAEESRASNAALAELQRQVQNNEEMLDRAKLRLDALESEP